MTEAMWLTKTDPWKMLLFIWKKRYERQRRLFACACCRNIWQWLDDKRGQNAIEIVEQFVDNHATKRNLRDAFVAVQAVIDPKILTLDARDTTVIDIRKLGANANQTAFAACASNLNFVSGAASVTHKAVVITHSSRTDRGIREEVGQWQCELIRDVFGNPFQTYDPVSSACRDETISLALAAYERRTLPNGYLDTALLSSLADALGESGCNVPAVVDHLKSPGFHVRGCWALDLILGKRDDELGHSTWSRWTRRLFRR